jgi:tetratricopeptide (TPR) repeat protein
MAPTTYRDSLPVRDPSWTLADYLRLAEHKSSRVRFWALDRMEALELDVPAEVLRRRLDDSDGSVAATAARLIGDRDAATLADALVARLERAEDAVGVTCAMSLAHLGDRRFIAVLRGRTDLSPADRDPRVWQALALARTPEATDAIRRALATLPARGAASAAASLGAALAVADPATGLPPAVDRWLGAENETEADLLLNSLLSLLEFPGGAEELRDAMRSAPHSDESGMVEGILDVLAETGPLGPIGEVRRACLRGKWGRALEGLVVLADALAHRMPGGEGDGFALSLVRALGARAKRLASSGSKGQDAVGLGLLALERMEETVRESGLALPEIAEEQFRWLLGDAASAHRFAPLFVLGRLRNETPSGAWIETCLRAIERRLPQAVLCMELAGAWRAEAAVPVLAACLGERDDADLAGAAIEALIAIGDPALDGVLDRLGTSEDPEVLTDCLEVCERLPARRAVEAICRRFDALFVLVPDELVECVETIAAPEFVEPLGRELREGEPAAESAFLLLCEIHGIADPRLPGIRDREAERRRLVERLARDPDDTPRDHLVLPLQCTGCRRTYRYAVREVYLDPEVPEGERLQPFIRDRIRCKGCGREDEYVPTPQADWLLLAELTMRLARRRTGESPDPESGPLRVAKLGLADGRRMNPREALRHYETQLAERPDDPGLHIGHGNVLRFLWDGDRATAAYRRALELDPRAVEAYATLGQLAEERGDLAEAHALYGKCVALGRDARFYQVRDRGEFRRAIQDALDNVAASLAARPPEAVSAQTRLEALSRADRGETKVGRNDPCPCGSGKKFKKCCLLKESPAPPAGQPSAPDQRLRARLVEYVQRSLPRADMDRAMRDFFGEDFDFAQRTLVVSEATEEQWPAFLEWLIHDFRLGTGETPIARFLAERGKSVPGEERGILEEWQDAIVGLHEVVDLEPGKSLTLRNVFDGRTFRVREVRGSLSAGRWDILTHRIIRVNGEPRLSGLGLAFRAADREKLLAHITARYDAFRREHPAATWDDFFRAEPLAIRRYAAKMQQEYRPPALYTPEGHPVLFGRLRYGVQDNERLMRSLLAAPDFDETTAPDEPAGTRQFAWLRTGPAERHVQEAAKPDHGMMVTSQRFDDPRRPGVTGLATLTVIGREMTAEALSAQRLAWLKARLAEVAGDVIQLRADVVEEPWRKLEAKRGSHPPARPAAAVPPEVEAQLLGTVLHRHFTAWLDQPVPALDGQTPRAAARDARWRPKLIQLLREIENHQDHARREGRAWYDIGWMWKELGIARTEA